MIGRAVLVVVTIAACTSTRPRPITGLAVAHVWGGAVPRYLERPEAAWLAPDGRTAIVVGESGKTVLVAAMSGERLATIALAEAPFGDGTANAVAFSPDGRRFAIADQGRACVALWTIQPAREETCLPSTQFKGAVVAALVAFSPDSAALAVVDDARLTRWSIATHTVAWSSPRPQMWLRERFLGWPTDATIVVGGNQVTAHDAASGGETWVHPAHFDQYLGVAGGELVVAGAASDARDSSIARLDLATGALRDRTTSVDGFGGGALLDDATAVIVDDAGVAHRFRLGGGELDQYRLPFDVATVAAARDGRVAVVVSGDGLSLWDLRAGQPIATGDAQLAPIIALDADGRGVVSAAADGSVVVRGVAGGLIERRHARATSCRAWSVSAAARHAMCAAEPTLALGGAGPEPPIHESIDLDRDRHRAIDWHERSEVADGDAQGTIWSASGNLAVWIDPHGSSGPDIELGTESPRVVRIVDGGRAVVYGGATSHGPFEHSPGGWWGLGLSRMDRRGAIRSLDAQVKVVALATDHAGDVLVVAAADSLQLWRPSGTVEWARRWLTDVEATAVAVSDGGEWIAPPHAGAGVALSAGRPGAAVARDEVDQTTGLVTALAFAGHTLYAGTSAGEVLVIEPR